MSVFVGNFVPSSEQKSEFRSKINGVGYTTDAVSGSVTSISKLTQAQYDALPSKNASTLYVIVA